MSKSRLRRERAAIERVAAAFDPAALQRICELPEREFAAAFDLDVTETPKPTGGFYAHRDSNSAILAVAHLDTVADADDRSCAFVDTAAGQVVFSRALDDRLGAYVILDLLPKLGIKTDVLLTTGEEIGQSTAQFFDAPGQYNWMIEFDRGGTDVVLYQYDEPDLRERVRDAGATVNLGMFSDIAYLDHLGCSGLNWGVGYREYHEARSHAFLTDTFRMVARFLAFHEANAEEFLPYADPWDDADDTDDLGDAPRHLLWNEDDDDDDDDRDDTAALRSWLAERQASHDAELAGANTKLPADVATMLEGSW